MCGIVGVVAQGPVDIEQLRAMRSALHHRGPDQHGEWIQDNIGLAHQRLSIIDTSSAGQQPFISADGRWVITYNGEIYNFNTLRQQLPEVAWRGHSDTEVLVEAIAAWGIEDTLTKLNGIFAFAAYDRTHRKLYLARDPVGIKPLYYGVTNGSLYFASELHPLRLLPGLSLDQQSISSFLRYRYVPCPATIFKEFHKLPAGHFVCLDAQDPTQLQSPSCYWDYATYARAEQADISLAEASQQLDSLLHQAVARQLVSDVPIGAFLSGGIDSSLLCAIASQHTSTPLNTFSIGFADEQLDEAPYAKAIAQHLGTNHTELYVTEQDLLESVTRLSQLCDEPFADSSILPTYLVSKLARQQVTVALSGDGGDELFWGYTRYATTQRLWQALSRWPLSLRQAGAAICAQRWLQALTRPVQGLALGGRKGSLAQKLAAASEFMHSPTQADLYHQLVSHWRRPDEILLDAANEQSVYANRKHWTRELSLWPQMASQDFLSYLPDDILTKVDRASMQVGLETRVPLLDQELVQFATTLPAALKNADGQSKVLLRKVLGQYVPSTLFERPKAGFGVPLARWLRGPLQDWAHELLRHDKVQDVFNSDSVDQLWHEHLSGRADNAAKLWDILMLQNWRLPNSRSPD